MPRSCLGLGVALLSLLGCGPSEDASELREFLATGISATLPPQTLEHLNRVLAHHLVRSEGYQRNGVDADWAAIVAGEPPVPSQVRRWVDDGTLTNDGRFLPRAGSTARFPWALPQDSPPDGERRAARLWAALSVLEPRVESLEWIDPEPRAAWLLPPKVLVNPRLLQLILPEGSVAQVSAAADRPAPEAELETARAPTGSPPLPAPPPSDSHSSDSGIICTQCNTPGCTSSSSGTHQDIGCFLVNGQCKCVNATAWPPLQLPLLVLPTLLALVFARRRR